VGSSASHLSTGAISRVRIRGLPRCPRRAARPDSRHASIPAPPPRAARVRRGVRLVQGAREPLRHRATLASCVFGDMRSGGRSRRPAKSRRSASCRSTSPNAPPPPRSERSRSPHGAGPQEIASSGIRAPCGPPILLFNVMPCADPRGPSHPSEAAVTELREAFARLQRGRAQPTAPRSPRVRVERSGR
jgi:hypothetical protein